MDFYKLIRQIELLGGKIDDLNELKNFFLLHHDSRVDILEGWLPRHIVMKVFGYGNTQMTAVAKNYDFITAKIGSKIFYQKKSIVEALNRNTIDK